MDQSTKRPTMTRRAFVVGAAGFLGTCAVGGVAVGLGGESAALRPPGGQDEDAFLANCLKCDKCRSICPENCISTGVLEDGLLNYRTPKLDFHRGSCTFCDLCIQVCPTKALSPFDKTVDAIGVAVVDSDECIAFVHGGCQKCVEACEYDAIYLDGNGCPVVKADACNGCGVCEYVCPSSSLRSYSGSNLRGINVQRKSEEASQ